MAILLTVVTCLVFNWTAISGGESQQAAKVDDSAQAQVLAQAGWQLWKQQKFADAEAKFEEAVKLDEKLDNAWNGLGWSQFNQGKTKDAIEAFKECVKLTPDHGAALNGLGQAHFSLREYDAAEPYLLKAEDSSAAWYGLMKLYVLQGKFPEADKYLGKLEASAGQSEPADLEEIKQAIADEELSDSLRKKIEPFIQVESANDEVNQLTKTGWQFFKQGKNKQAVTAFKKALKTDPDHMPAINGLAFSLLNQGKAADAQPMFEQLLESDPDHFGAMNGLARCLKSAGKTSEAIKVWEDMQEKMPGFNAATTGLGTTYFELKSYEEAIPYLEKMVAGVPGNASFSEMLETAKAKTK